MLWIILGTLISYLIGSLPTAYLFGRMLKGIDLRKFGSGNVGATNAFRVLGKAVGLIVLGLDILKGWFPLIFIGDFLLVEGINFSAEGLRIILGLSTILGHNWTIFLHFQGGKGVATTLGVLLGLSFKIPGMAKILGIVVLLWVLTFILFRIVSLSSVLASLVFPALVIFFKPSLALIIFSCLAAIFILWRHRANLKRIFQGKETRLFF